MKSASAELSLDYLTVSALSGAERALEIHAHSSSALDGAAALLTVTLARGVAVSLPWSWSRQPQGRA